MGKPTYCRLTELAPPNPDQIEITLFGPGYGECGTVHLGENRWIVIDSCLNTETSNAAVLDYYAAIGIYPQEAVKLIVISHWHDDHVRGLSDVVSSCPSAYVCCSSALTTNEFLSHILDYRDIMTKTTSTGVSEIDKTLQILKSRPSSPIKRALANRPVLNLPAEGNADSCIVTTLSPSDKEYANFIKGIATLIPSNLKTKTRAPSLTPNNAAVALWIQIGDVKILLGSDLEEKGEMSSGWSAIVRSEERPRGLASVFKIPHHGSSTGHHDKVWSDMMVESPIAILSPFYQAGKMLPTSKDIARIVALTPLGYITTRYPVPQSKIRRSQSVERTIRETVKKMRAVQSPMGWISLRNGGKSSPDFWTVKMSIAGSHLNDLIAS